MTKTVLTYGSFDLFHVGHLRLLTRLAAMGDRLIVGVSTDAFNALKGKQTVIPFEQRREIVAGLAVVDAVLAEDCWEQKADDIRAYSVSVLGMGADWTGRFDFLQDRCEVVYLARTTGISSSEVKAALRVLDESHLDDLKKALDVISSIVGRLE